MKPSKLALWFHLLVLAFLGSCATVFSQADSEQLRLVPFPKEITLQPGRFAIARSLILEVPNTQSNVIAGVLNDELIHAGLRPAVIRALNSPVFAFRLSARSGALMAPLLPTGNAPQGYALEVRANEIVCAARDPAGLLYGAQTLCQLLRANCHGGAIGCLTIRDWPTLRWRCFQDDLTRGPSSTLTTLKSEASLGAYLKLNLMSYYMEYQYAFKKHPQIGPTNGSLTEGELSALVRRGKTLHLDILGSQQSFGHFGRILEHPEFSRLRETADVLTPVHEETYELLADFYSEVCPVLPFPWFNVCCDETDGLGTGPAHELTTSIGVGGVYARHLHRLHDLLRDKYHKRMMMWGDIIRQHPENLKDIPTDTILLIWGYDARDSFDDLILPFAKSGFDFFVCPGVSDWNRILPDFSVSVTNIQHFVRDGAKHGALGMLNTDWEDDGEALKAVKWYADAWAAECAWNGSTTPPELFNRRVGAVLFGETGDEFGQAVELLSCTHRLPGMNGMLNARFWDMNFVPASDPVSIQSAASNLLAVVRPALRHLDACRLEARDNQHVLDVILFGAHRMEIVGQRMLDGLEAARRYARAAGAAAGGDSRTKQSAAASLADLQRVDQLIRQNRDAHQALGVQFARLWLSESKPYALDWTLNRYTDAVKGYESLLQKLAVAQQAFVSGQPLPSPQELGLASP